MYFFFFFFHFSFSKGAQWKFYVVLEASCLFVLAESIPKGALAAIFVC